MARAGDEWTGTLRGGSSRLRWRAVMACVAAGCRRAGHVSVGDQQEFICETKRIIAGPARKKEVAATMLSARARRAALLARGPALPSVIRCIASAASRMSAIACARSSGGRFRQSCATKSIVFIRAAPGGCSRRSMPSPRSSRGSCCTLGASHHTRCNGARSSAGSRDRRRARPLDAVLVPRICSISSAPIRGRLARVRKTSDAISTRRRLAVTETRATLAAKSPNSSSTTPTVSAVPMRASMRPIGSGGEVGRGSPARPAGGKRGRSEPRAPWCHRAGVAAIVDFLAIVTPRKC